MTQFKKTEATTVPSYIEAQVGGNPAPAYAELHCLSNYSFLRGASHPEELIHQAAALGYPALALTDECSFSGLVKAHIATRELADQDIQIKLIVGAEFHLEDGINEPCTLIFLAPNRTAYGQLSALITKLRRRSPKGEYQCLMQDLAFAGKECLALWVPPSIGIEALIQQGRALKSQLPALWIALELFHEPDDLDKMANALTLSMRLDLPIVATGNVHTHDPQRQPLQDILTAIRLKMTVADLGHRTFRNAERHLRTPEALLQLYPPEMLAESCRIAERCDFSMEELRYEYPEELVPPHLTPSDYLRQLTLEGGAQRWPDGIPGEVSALIEKELKLIHELRFEYYFLTVQDIVQFARSQGILCQGRGSAANSAVCYCLHITEVDPARIHLLFERFISKERHEPPDIDVDFEHERREEVIQYIYKRYSRDRAALAATLITYRPRSAIRDVGKALGMSQDLVDLLAKSMSWWEKREALSERFRAIGLDPESTQTQQFLHFTREILGFPRHLSQHVGGFVISQGPLAQLVPIENAAMKDRTVIQWDKDDLEALGLLKIDVLGLGMLTAIRKALTYLNEYRHSDLTIAQIPPEDPATYRMLQEGDSVGVFQVESRAQMAMLPRLKPQRFYDLVIEVAIVRPGPIQGDMVHPYLRRRQGLEPVVYSNDAVRRVLERTLGIPLFQEQVIELAMVAAGFSAGEADQLRRAMAAWRRRGGLNHFRQKLIDGMRARGHDQEFAERIFRQIQGFGEYGFPESHAASFALLVYVSAWLKRHEPAAFYCGLLNSLPMGFYSPSQLIQDAARHQIEVRAVDVQFSTWDHHLSNAPGPSDQPALQLGLRLIKGLAQTAGDQISDARLQKGAFHDPADLRQRAGLNDQAMKYLAQAGALRSLSGHRHQAHWDVAGLQRPTPLDQAADVQAHYHTDVTLPAPSTGDNVLADYRYLGLSLEAHPMALLRKQKALRRYRTAASLLNSRHGQAISVAGIVTGRQRPSTASGVLFVTLEDETGNLNLVVWSSVFERYRAILLQSQLLMVKGVVERENKAIHVVAGHIEDGNELLTLLSNKKSTPVKFHSRNFR